MSIDETPTTPTTTIPRDELVLGAISALAGEMREGFKAAESRDVALDAKADTLALNVTHLGGELSITNKRVSVVEERLNRQSGGVKELRQATSEHDLSQDKALSEEILARQDLATKVDTILRIGIRLDKLSENPTIKLIIFAAGIVVAGWLAQHGIRNP